MSDQFTFTFPRPKDAREQAWYVVQSLELVDVLLSVNASVSIVSQVANVYYQDLLIDNSQINLVPYRLTSGENILPGHGMFFRVSQGKPGATYKITLQYKTATDGSVLFRDVFLEVLGL